MTNSMDTSITRPFVQHTHHSNSVSSHDSSASSVASAPTLIPPPLSFYASTGATRTQAVTESANSSARSSGAYNSLDYKYHPYSTSSTSPVTMTVSSLHDPSGPNDHYSSAAISPTQISGSSLSAQKRAYRQRRKDPSCDACRERKVKCDATETSSCSECTSRTVKCQFTKETNRRMSSIKQVQDLQNQLEDAKQQINHLRSLLQNASSKSDVPLESPTLNLPAIGHRMEKGHGLPPVPNNFDHVRKALKTYSRGIFKLPPLYRPIVNTPSVSSSELTLPPRHVTDTLMAQFYDYIHRNRPFIHWPSFLQTVDKVYAQDTFQGIPQIWAGYFFAIMACGTLQTGTNPGEGMNPDVDGMKYIVLASRLLNTWTDNLLSEHVRIAHMMSVFLTEQDIRSGGWIWHGSAIRMSRDTGLHLEGGPWPAHETISRRRIYWSVVAWDRLLALDGRPLQQYEEEYEVPWPSKSEEEWLIPRGAHKSATAQNGFSAMSMIIPVVRFIPQLKKTLKSRVIARATLHTYEDYFRAIMSSYPDAYQMQSDGYLEPWSLHAVFPLQVARFMLYRHNLNTLCQPLERAEALNNCVCVAHDTVKYILRCMKTPPPAQNFPEEAFRESIRSQADNFMCMHIWRCTLVLCLKGDYSAAMTCVRLSSIIGDMRKLNLACGRHLSFFLGRLMDRVNSSAMTQHQLEQDEEMIAYASGDMQGDPENSWVWSGGEAGLSNAARAQPDGLPPSALLSETELNDWGGLKRVEGLLQDLLDEQQRRQNQPQNPFHKPAHNTTKRLQLSPQETPALAQTPSIAAGASRISIANII